MNKLFWLIAGVALGAAAAKQINENPEARKAYEQAKAALQEFSDAVNEGYREREAELAKPSRSKVTSKASTSSSSKASKRSTPRKSTPKTKTAGK
jgi:hypothetical protein